MVLLLRPHRPVELTGLEAIRQVGRAAPDHQLNPFANNRESNIGHSVHPRHTHWQSGRHYPPGGSTAGSGGTGGRRGYQGHPQVAVAPGNPRALG